MSKESVKKRGKKGNEGRRGYGGRREGERTRKIERRDWRKGVREAQIGGRARRLISEEVKRDKQCLNVYCRLTVHISFRRTRKERIGIVDRGIEEGNELQRQENRQGGEGQVNEDRSKRKEER